MELKDCHFSQNLAHQYTSSGFQNNSLFLKMKCRHVASNPRAIRTSVCGRAPIPVVQTYILIFILIWDTYHWATAHGKVQFYQAVKLQQCAGRSLLLLVTKVVGVVVFNHLWNFSPNFYGKIKNGKEKKKRKRKKPKTLKWKETADSTAKRNTHLQTQLSESGFWPIYYHIDTFVHLKSCN